MTDEGLVEFLLDQLGDPAVSSRAMFGGHGIYRSGSMFALVYRGEVYMKVSDEEAEFSDREPFRPNERQTLRSYRLVGPDELEGRDELAAMAERAQKAAGTRS